MSDDGEHGLALIAFVGSVFSPYYASARRRSAGGAAEPAAHCSLNVALYGPGRRRRWTMTERGARHTERATTHYRIGPSQLRIEGRTLRFDIDEITAPLPSRIRGTIELQAGAWQPHPVALDPAARHHWSVLAPCARVNVALSAPGLRWSGPAYCDGNWGSEPLERGFVGWQWMRARRADDSTVVCYEMEGRDHRRRDLALTFAPGREAMPFSPPPLRSLPTTGWGVARAVRADAGAPVSVTTLESGPFYARSRIDTVWEGEPLTAFHESLSLDRFAARWVQMLLPFRMPRRG